MRLIISFYLLLTIFSITYSQTGYTKFEKLSVDEGLSQNSVTSILEDSKGLMWFGTNDGLNKYDGYSFTIYRKEFDDTNSIGNNNITAIIEDKNSKLWVGTQAGLYTFNRHKSIFENFKLPQTDYNDNIIKKLLYDSKGFLWAATRSGIIYKIDIKTKKIERYFTVNEYGKLVVDNEIYALVEIDNNIWIGSTKTGINIIYPDKKKIVRHKIYDYKTQKRLSDFAVTSIFRTINNEVCFNEITNTPIIVGENRNEGRPLISKDNFGKILGYTRSFAQIKQGEIWFGSDASGLAQYNYQTNKLTEYNYKNSNLPRLTNFSTFYSDKNGILWIGTNGTGVFYFAPVAKSFQTIFKGNEFNKGLSFSSIRSIYALNNNGVYIGGYGGLNYLDNKNFNITVLKTATSYMPNHYSPSKVLPSDLVYSMVKDFKEPEKYLWIGSEGQGLFKYDVLNNLFYSIKIPIKDSIETLTFSQIYSLLFDKSGRLWIGTVSGVMRLSEDLLHVELFKYDRIQPNSLQLGSIKALYMDKAGIIWFGSDLGGLSYYDEKIKGFVKFVNNPKDFSSLSNNQINSIYEDKKGNFWIATWGGGLNLFDRKTKKFYIYTTKNGLPNNIVYGILEDDENYLWLSTNIGLSKFNPKTKTFVNFDYTDGLQGNEFNRNAHFKAVDGTLYFGGISGLTFFKPNMIKINTKIPNIVLTAFKIFNKPIIKKEDIAFTKEFVLYPGDNVFSFEFAALNYYHPAKNKYAYKLEGFNEEWIYLNNKHDVTFTNLTSGTYYLKIIGSNNDGIWNKKGLTIKIIVVPPFYKTLWFILTMVIIIAGFVIGYIYVKTENTKKHREILERLVSQKTNQLTDSNKLLIDEIENKKNVLSELEKSKIEAEKANLAKSMFLANMTHEIKTPMNSVLGFADLLYNGITDPKLKNYAQSILSSGKMLLTLINDILALAKIESGTLKPNYETTKINDVICEISELFVDQVKEKKMEMIVDIDPELPSKIIIDETLLRQILVNLIGNAVKFTNEGKITVVAKQENINLEKRTIDLFVSVADTGIGISGELKDKIFESFFQLDNNTERKYGGTGLGLSITKKLVEMMNGNLNIESKVNEGSRFEFLFRNVNFIPNELNYSTPKKEFTADMVVFNQQLVLIVDDAEINRKLLRAYLTNVNCIIIEANDGEEAIQLSREKIPDLILMDLNMPKIGGVEACKIIRSEEKTRWIPIIALSATSIDATRINSVDGFNSYLKKPISRAGLIGELMKYLKYSYSNLEADEGVKNQKSNSWDYIDISKNSNINYLELLLTLKTKYLPRITTLKNTFVITHIEEFAREIILTGEKNNLILFTSWGNNLLKATESIDMEQMINLLTSFNMLVDGFEKKIKQFNKINIFQSTNQ
ncbi:MAG: two-component regulator propeller domain-containing protein [bacterium]